MKKYVNGQYIELTPEEIAAMQEESERAEAYERKRPLTEYEVSRMLIAEQINMLAVDDATALRMREFYPDWKADTAYTVGFKVQRNGRLYKVVQAHTSQAGWEPENVASLWTEICETHDGSKYDPIPYDGNMVLENGKYYTQGDVLYVCTRDTVNPVYHALADLVGLYVEVV